MNEQLKLRVLWEQVPVVVVRLMMRLVVVVVVVVAERN